MAGRGLARRGKAGQGLARQGTHHEARGGAQHGPARPGSAGRLARPGGARRRHATHGRAGLGKCPETRTGLGSAWQGIGTPTARGGTEWPTTTLTRIAYRRRCCQRVQAKRSVCRLCGGARVEAHHWAFETGIRRRRTTTALRPLTATVSGTCRPDSAGTSSGGTPGAAADLSGRQAATWCGASYHRRDDGISFTRSVSGSIQGLRPGRTSHQPNAGVNLEQANRIKKLAGPVPAKRWSVRSNPRNRDRACVLELNGSR